MKDFKMPGDDNAQTPPAAKITQPIRMCIAALGGEGGGVLTAWIVAVARAQGWPVQSTSVPGVAQRTGATTYYVEILPQVWQGPGKPILALTPTPGFVDVVVATELLEAARAIEQGFVSPDRTTLIASSHRAFTIEEKSGMADERIAPEKILRAIDELSLRTIPVDFAKLAKETNAFASSVVLGAIAGSGVLPAPREVYEDAMRASGTAIDANLRGFAAAYDAVTGSPAAVDYASDTATAQVSPKQAGFGFPAEVESVLAHAVPRLQSYQSKRYANRYLALLRQILEAEQASGTSAQGYRVTSEAARYLALMMSYEDIVRVAALKTAPQRWAEVYDNTPLGAKDIVRVTEFLKPGVEEFASLMPPWLGRRIVAWARRRGKLDAYNIGLGVRTTSAGGFLLMRMLASLRFWRPFSYRFSIEMPAIEAWVDQVVKSTRIDRDFGAEVVECARIRKGYGSTHRRGTANFEALMERIVAPAVAEGKAATAELTELRKLALSDPDGNAMIEELDRHVSFSRT